MKKILLGLILFLIPSVALADGGLVMPSQFYAREADQKAIIVHYDGVEHLILSINFESDSEDFGWIVPVPTRPEVNEVREDIFERVSEMVKKTKRETKYYSMPVLGTNTDSGATSYVEVLETKIVGDLVTEVVDTNDSQLFYSWLNSHDYEFPESRTDILDYYIDNDWFFVLSKVVPGREKSGDTQPIKITFESGEIVYPMKMTQISFEEKRSEHSKWDTTHEESIDLELLGMYFRRDTTQHGGNIALDLFVFADESYVDRTGNGVTHSHVEASGKVDRLPVSWLVGESLGWSPKINLTKLSSDLDLSKMTDDWYFAKYLGGNVGQVSSNWFVIQYWQLSGKFGDSIWIGLILMILMWLILRWLLGRLGKVKSKVWLVVFWLIIWLLWSHVWYILLFWTARSSSYEFYQFNSNLEILFFGILLFLLVYPQFRFFYWLGQRMMKFKMKQMIKEVKEENK
ncbi:DUF2330 domain-containing protein [Patescibacteria group bacterium]|nr:DUF2330 domain-containing protein [Patescibacteria group bacterium]